MRLGEPMNPPSRCMTWVEDTTKGGKQCPPGDVTEADVSRRGAGRTCLMIGNECQHNYTSSRGKTCHDGLLHRSVVPSFSCCF